MRQFSLEEQRRRKREGDRDQQRERMRNATEEQRQAPGQAERKRSALQLVNCKHVGYSFLDFYLFVIGNNFVPPNNLRLRFCFLFYRSSRGKKS